jgi:hypothetical protein
MRAPSDKRSTDKRIDDEAAAIEEARRRLHPLFVDVVSWNSRGADTSSPKKKLGATIGLVAGALNEAERALNELKRIPQPHKRARDVIADAILFITIARKGAIPILQQARPWRGRHGQHSELNASRNQTIAETVASTCEQFGLSQERASWVVSTALQDLWAEHRQTFKRFEKRGADPAWIDECLRFIDKLRLSEDRVEDIAKKYRT